MTQTRPARDDLSPQEAADLLGLNRTTVLRWLHGDRIAGWRTVGGRWRVPRSEVERLLRPVSKI